MMKPAFCSDVIFMFVRLCFFYGFYTLPYLFVIVAFVYLIQLFLSVVFFSGFTQLFEVFLAYM